jgi:hypothetical protein
VHRGNDGQMREMIISMFIIHLMLYNIGTIPYLTLQNITNPIYVIGV